MNEPQFLEWLFSKPQHQQTTIIKMLREFRTLGVPIEIAAKLIRELTDKA